VYAEATAPLLKTAIDGCDCTVGKVGYENQIVIRKRCTGKFLISRSGVRPVEPVPVPDGVFFYCVITS